MAPQNPAVKKKGAAPLKKCRRPWPVNRQGNPVGGTGQKGSPAAETPSETAAVTSENPVAQAEKQAGKNPETEEEGGGDHEEVN